MRPVSFVFVSTMRSVPWGGSETLWHGAARHLLARGVGVHTYTSAGSAVVEPLRELSRLGAFATFEENRLPLTMRLLRRVAPLAYSRKRNHRIRDWLAGIDSPRVIISCGSLLDDFSELAHLSDDRIPYAVIVQAAAPEIWPGDAALGDIAKLLFNARGVFFVSRHNREDVQQCLGVELKNAEVISNPANLPLVLHSGKTIPPFPATEGLSLACVARLDVHAKGQDILLRALASEKWRARDVSLTFYGEGPHRMALQNAARYLGVPRVSFAGQVGDIATVWAKHQLGALASRFEGLPLSVIEAMMLGRANVVPRNCGSAEIVDDNVTGFVAAAPTADAFDEALERAWQRRTELAAIGALAAQRIRQLLPADPCLELANRLAALL